MVKLPPAHLRECFGGQRLRAVEYARVRSGTVQGYEHECVETFLVTLRGQGMAEGSAEFRALQRACLYVVSPSRSQEAP